MRTIISLAKNLNLEVVAEGVETERQLNFLRDNGCQHEQDFLIGKPMASDELEFIIRDFTVMKHV